MQQTEIALLAATAMISLGFPEGSLEILKQGEEAAAALKDSVNLTSLTGLIGLYYSVKGDTTLGLRYSEDSYEMALESGDIDLIAPAAFDLCSNYSSCGQFERVIAIAPSVMESLENSDREYEAFGRGYNTYSGLAAFLGFAFSLTGNYREGWSFFEKGVRMAEKSGNLYGLGLAEVLWGYCLCHQGNGQAALGHFEKSIEYLEKGQIFVLLGLAWTGIGYSRYLNDRPIEALAMVQKGLAMHRETGVVYNLCAHYEFAAMIYNELRDPEKAMAHIEQALALAEKNSEFYRLGSAMVTKGRVLSTQGTSCFEEARRAVVEGMGILERVGARPNCAMANLILSYMDALEGRPSAALRLQAAKDVFKELEMRFWTAKAHMLELAFEHVLASCRNITQIADV